MPVINAHEISPETGSIQIYNGMDAALTHEIYANLDGLSSNPEDELIYAFERGLQGPALEMMQRGFKIDHNALDIAQQNTKLKLDATKQVLDTLTNAVCDRVFNPMSGMQLKELFYANMNIEPIKVWKRTGETFPMDRKILEKIEEYFYARPIANAVLVYRDLAKTLQTLTTEIDDDWRWRTSYNITGTTTGRWSSSKNLTGTGGNLQNITDELRRIFIADSGMKLGGFDLEQSEAREVGWFCGTILGDWSYLDVIESGDPHTYVARMCFPELPWTGDLKLDKPIAQRKFYRHFSYRDATKRLSHGSNYLGKPSTMAENTKIPISVVKPFQERYFNRFPCITRMHQWIAREIQTKGYLITPFGRRRDFFDRTDSEETIRGAVAHMFQSSTGDRLNLGLYRVWRDLGTEIQILAQLHDGFYFQYRDNDPAFEKYIMREIKSRVEIPLTHILQDGKTRTFVIPSEAQNGYNWAHRYRITETGTKEDWNPKGLDVYRF